MTVTNTAHNIHEDLSDVETMYQHQLIAKN